MLVFGHILFTFYFLRKILKNVSDKKVLAMSILGLAPDIDILIGIPHRTFTHTILFIPYVIIAAQTLQMILRLNLPFRMVIIVGIISYLTHLLADVITGQVQIFPGIYVGYNIFGISIFKSDILFGMLWLAIFYADKNKNKLKNIIYYGRETFRRKSFRIGEKNTSFTSSFRRPHKRC